MTIQNVSSEASVGDLLESKRAVNKNLAAAGGDAVNEDTQTVQKPSVGENAKKNNVATTTSASMMSGNFFNTNYERSKYVNSVISSRQQDQTFSTRMNSLVAGLTAQAQIWNTERQFGGASLIENTYVIGQRLMTASSAATTQVKKDETVTQSEKNLEELREDIEQKAEEATAGQDADGASAADSNAPLADSPVDAQNDFTANNEEASSTPATESVAETSPASSSPVDATLEISAASDQGPASDAQNSDEAETPLGRDVAIDIIV
ncbi:MAG: hypothetical protein AB7D07_05060 [Desulfovibrionaceae bacterium]